MPAPKQKDIEEAAQPATTRPPTLEESMGAIAAAGQRIIRPKTGRRFGRITVPACGRPTIELPDAAEILTLQADDTNRNQFILDYVFEPGSPMAQSRLCIALMAPHVILPAVPLRLIGTFGEEYPRFAVFEELPEIA